MRILTTAAALLLATALPAFADAVTYKGTIGDIPIVVELSADPTAPGTEPFGRYFYPSKGVDIPLTFMQAEPGLVVLREEGPCTETTCVANEDGTVLEPPFGALWQLEFGDGDGASLTGAWQADGSPLKLRLERVGSRDFSELDSGPEGLTSAARDALWTGAPLTMETAPYDVLKMQSVKYEMPLAEFFDDGSSVLYLTDPRTVFAFPRIAGLAGDADETAADGYLEQRHWAMNADALGCAARQYPSMGWNSFAGDMAGTLGYWDEEQVEVTYLSPTVMSWTESGSLFCGGAYPHNHSDIHNLDVRAGAPLDLTRIFADWQALIDHVLANRTPGDTDFEAECGTEDLIRNYLTVGFKRDDRVRFALGGLPHVIHACADDVWEVPLAELPKELFAPEAKDYFPSL
jgi:hypothetical protein